MGTLANAIGVLGVLSTTLEAVPVVGSNLKVAAELASKICETVQNIKENRKSYEDLALHVEQLLVAISAVLQKARPERLGAMTANVGRLMKVLEEIQVTVHDRTRSNTPSPVGACGPLSTWLCNTSIDVTRMTTDEDNVKEMRRKLDEVVVEFDVGAHMRTELRVESVERLVRLAAANISQIQVQMQANNERTKLEEESRLNAERVAQNNLLDSLKPVSSATWEAGTTEGCTPDTRVLLLDEVMSWVDDPTGSCVFWLSGLAGTGKSTIARTLCQRLRDRGMLGASYFISRQYQSRRNASNIVRTLAHQLALRERAFAGALCSVLRERPMSAARSLEMEIEDFIGQPAGTLGAASSLVIVLDALDECLADYFGRPGGDLLVLLVRQLISISAPLKLFVTSRAESSIERMFEGLSNRSQRTGVELHKLDTTMVEQDIRTYLLGAFRQICLRRTTLDLCDWPRAEDLERLVQNSGLLFVYASTIIRFVGDRQHSPRDRLGYVLGQQQAGGLSKPFKALDKLYTQILIDAAQSSDEDEDEREETAALYQRLRDVLAVVILVKTPLRIDAVAVLSGLTDADAHIAIHSLFALLLVDAGEPVQIFHPSFPDFVTDPERCTEKRLCVEPKKHHAHLALQCLMLMNSDLRYDICDIQDPNIANLDVTDLETRLRQRVSDALRYACCFWPVHLMASGIADEDVNVWNALSEFSRKHLFHWLEVLSLLQRLPMAEAQLLESIEWCKKLARGRDMPTVAQLFYDTVRVLQEYRVALRSHALHAYHSAFVTMPECSLLHALQQENLPGSLPSMVSPRVLHWGSWNRVIDGHTREVVCVAVSPDGQRIVSGSRDGTLRVWSAVTLEELAKVTQGKAYTCSIAFSPDGARFVTSSMAGSIHLWDFVTLQQLVALDLNRDAISQLGRASLNCKAFHAIFSNDATRIIASAGAEVCIWGAATFEELGRFNASAPLALSPDDTRVVACLSGTMTEPAVYDATTCEELFQLENLAADVHAIAFSPDGRQVVFGLTGNSLRVWNAITWEEVARLQTGPSIGSVTSITFSPCRTHMVSASADQALHIWDTTSAYKEISKLRGHEGLALAVVFSPDGTQLVSGSEDKTVRIWNAKDFGDSLGLEDDRVRRKWARDISFLPCGSRITTHSVDEPFSVWDAETSTKLGEIQDVPLSHESPVVVSSLDGSLITTRYGPHHSLRVWDTATFEMVAELERQFDVETSFVCAAFSPDNTRIVSGMRNGAVLAWSILNSEVLVEFNQQNGRIKCIAYSPGGSHFAAGDDFALRIWSTATYEELYVYHSPRPAACLEFSHDGARLVTLFSPRKGPLKDTICVVWSVDTFEVLAQIKSDFYREPIFTADGKGVLFYHHDRVDGITSAWMPSQADNATWTEVPLSAVRLPKTTNATGYDTKAQSRLGMCLSQTGWLNCWMGSTLRLIWLPYDRRNWDKAMCGMRVAIAGEHRHGAAALTMLRFPERAQDEHRNVLDS